MQANQCHCCGQQSERLTMVKYCRPCQVQPRYLFHGGVAGLAPGMLLLPASVSRNPRTALGKAGDPRLAKYKYSPDRVYVTASLVMAANYAAMLGGAGGASLPFMTTKTLETSGQGGVYLVEPLGRVAHDPYFPAFMNIFACDFARIIAVVWERVPKAWWGLKEAALVAALPTPPFERLLAGDAQP